MELPELLVASDAVDALGAIVDRVANGQIAPYEAASLATLIDGYARAFNVADLELRLDSLERELQKLRNG